LFPLKFFFSSSLATETGNISSISVKERIKTIISEENQRKPISDQEIVKLLLQEDIKVARRTVTKYRENLGIPSTSERRLRN
jgi:RNA polymerase sigma-54 factor